MHWDTLSTDDQEQLIREEERLETCALDDGINRFRRQCAGQPMSKWPACRVLIAAATERLTKAIITEADKIAEGRGMKGGIQWGHVFLYMDPQVLATATICAMLDITTSKTRTQQAVIARIGDAIEMETHFTILKKAAPRLKAVMERKIKRWNRRTLRRAMTRLDQDCSKRWPYKRKLHLGSKLLGLAIEYTGLCQFELEWLRPKHVSKKIVLTEEAAATIAQMNEYLELLSPVFRPMICPPNPWNEETGTDGGYHVLSRYHTLLKTGMDYPDSMPADHGPMVYAGINSLQITPWAVQSIVLQTMETIWHNGGGAAGIPLIDNEDIPHHPNTEDDGEWRDAAEKVYRRNARAAGRRLAFLQTMQIAQQYRDRTFYFPYQCDFRGRIYPIPQFLQPQGNDIARGLLTFADTKPLGPDGLRWLYIQFANCWGQDKLNFRERVDWAERTIQPYLLQGQSLCERPFDMKELWLDADGGKKPWQALATLVEILAALSHPTGPENYPSSLPVNVDGSNSGLQHFSAMMRDRAGATLVNLVPLDVPNDIYSDVAVEVRWRIEEDQVATESGDLTEGTIETLHKEWFGERAQIDTTRMDLPSQWLKQPIDRRLCKRGTMTFCYGVTLQGLRNALKDDGFVDWAKDQFSALQYIGKKIWASILSNITGAAGIMEWLRKCAICANKADVLLQWRTPSGFHVLHPYQDPRVIRVRCLSGEAQFKVYDPERGIRNDKQKSSLPPNFVHSLDASHLILTVAAGGVNGIHYWMMIHDSFGTHACYMTLLSTILREQFVNLYTLDVLEDFRRQVIEQTGKDPGPPPEKGDWDLNEILTAEYAFA